MAAGADRAHRPHRDPAPCALVDAWCAAFGGGLVFIVYVCTLAPGLVAIRDTPAFQFIGRIVGIPHQPGYPFYVLVSHLFSYLPWGSLAFRINLFSALCGAATVSLLYLVFRQVAVARGVALAVAVAAGFGRVTWSQNIIAEIYALETLLLAGSILALLSWRDTRRPRTYYAAMFLLGLTFAHHTSDVTLAPAALAFVWLVDRRWVTRRRTLVWSGVAGLLAFAPYGLLILRTSQQAPYVLEPAHGVLDLARMITGYGYRDNVFVFGLEQVIRERLPLAASLLRDEVTLATCVCAIGGVAQLVRIKHPLGAFLMLGVAAQVGFVVNYDIPDLAVFFIPIVALVWIAAGFGIQLVVDALSQRRWCQMAVIGTTAALPIWLLWTNAHVVDLSWNIGTARYMDALVDRLPTRSVVLSENWVADQVVRYKTLGEGLPDGKAVIGPVAADPAFLDRAGSTHEPVLAFVRTADTLRVMGFPFVHERVWVSLRTFLEAQEPGSIVAVAAPAQAAGALDSGSGGLARIGGTRTQVGQRQASVALGVTGTRQGALERRDLRTARISLEAGRTIGATSVRAPSRIDLRAGLMDASIIVDGREIASSDGSAIVAVWDPGGRFREVQVAGSAADAPVPFEPMMAYRLAGPRRCRTLPPREWTDLGSLRLSALMAVNLSPLGSVTFEVNAGSAAPELRLIDASRGAAVSVSNEPPVADPGSAQTNPPVVAGEPHRGRWVGRGVVAVTNTAQPAWALVSLGTMPILARARPETADGSPPVTVCAVDMAGLLRPQGDHALALGMANDEQALMLGQGWRKADAAVAGPVRQMAQSEAMVFVALPDADAWHVRLVARGSSGAGVAPEEIGLRVNGTLLTPQRVTPGWHTYEWTALRPVLRSVNDMTIVTSPTTGDARAGIGGMTVGSMTFSRR